MTRLVRSNPKRRPAPRGRSWALQDAKASFSEVVRRARESGPQRVTVHGKDAVVVVSAEEFATLSVKAKYPMLSDLLADSPLNEIETGSEPIQVTVRPVEL